jgi:endogenous inhibitor of DNA gyrase (YacG/DUF329 family)
MTHKPCPICSRPASEAYAPFCCKRCAAIDLQRWFAGVYAVPVEEDQDELPPPPEPEPE